MDCSRSRGTSGRLTHSSLTQSPRKDPPTSTLSCAPVQTHVSLWACTRGFFKKQLHYKGIWHGGLWDWRSHFSASSGSCFQVLLLYSCYGVGLHFECLSQNTATFWLKRTHLWVNSLYYGLQLLDSLYLVSCASPLLFNTFHSEDAQFPTQSKWRLVYTSALIGLNTVKLVLSVVYFGLKHICGVLWLRHSLQLTSSHKLSLFLSHSLALSESITKVDIKAMKWWYPHIQMGKIWGETGLKGTAGDRQCLIKKKKESISQVWYSVVAPQVHLFKICMMKYDIAVDTLHHLRQRFSLPALFTLTCSPT